MTFHSVYTYRAYLCVIQLAASVVWILGVTALAMAAVFLIPIILAVLIAVVIGHCAIQLVRIVCRGKSFKDTSEIKVCESNGGKVEVTTTKDSDEEYVIVPGVTILRGDGTEIRGSMVIIGIPESRLVLLGLDDHEESYREMAELVEHLSVEDRGRMIWNLVEGRKWIVENIPEASSDTLVFRHARGLLLWKMTVDTHNRKFKITKYKWAPDLLDVYLQLSDEFLDTMYKNDVLTK